ncbi:MAG: DUF3179 domain-containing (seleno)protein, partial [Acidimicrobiia bacterium]
MRPARALALLAAVAVLAGVLIVTAVSGSDGESEQRATGPTTTVTVPSQGDEPRLIFDPQVELPDTLARLAPLWNTDWTRRTIEDLSELVKGIPVTDPRDAIPPIDAPKFEGVTAADQWLDDREPGLFLDFQNVRRFYPLRILTRHEIVNDVAAGEPLVVTYCPLCNTAIVFERTLNGQVLRFGVSGLLRNNDLVMWDNATESLWQQITGESIVGELAGRRLELLPSSLVR